MLSAAQWQRKAQDSSGVPQWLLQLLLGADRCALVPPSAGQP